jgi:hypothetical protein
VYSTCSLNGTTSSGGSAIANLTIAGQPITVTGQPNQTITVPNVATVIINEQITSTTPSSASIDVNAIHVKLTALGTTLGLASGDIIIAHSHCAETGTPATGRLTGHIYACVNGAPTTTEVPGGTIAVSQGSTVVDPPAPNPVTYTVPSGTYTLTAAPPAGYQLVGCGGPGGNTQTVVVPGGGTGSGGNFYVVPVPPTATVSVAYADNWNTAPGFFPTPWSGSPNTSFVGHAELTTPGGACTHDDCYDAGALRIDNTSTISENVTVTVDIGGSHYALWGANTVAPGKTLVLTQTSSDGSYNFDTSDANDGCTPNGVVPVVHVTINGTTTTLHDAGQILNTGGIDRSDCPAGTNEGHAWTALSS